MKQFSTHANAALVTCSGIIKLHTAVMATWQQTSVNGYHKNIIDNNFWSKFSSVCLKFGLKSQVYKVLVIYVGRAPQVLS